MTNHSDRAEVVYDEFVKELALSPGRFDLLDRLCSGHAPDDKGWCRHPTHTHHWERHPCSVVRLVELVDAAPLPVRRRL